MRPAWSVIDRGGGIVGELVEFGADAFADDGGDTFDEAKVAGGATMGWIMKLRISWMAVEKPVEAANPNLKGEAKGALSIDWKSAFEVEVGKHISVGTIGYGFLGV